jgi:peptidyl-prolyl cis-trans isomerase D
VLQAPNQGGWFVVHLERSVPGDAASSPGLVAATKTQFERIVGEEYAAQFGRAAERVVEVERNDGAIADAKKQLLGPGAR